MSGKSGMSGTPPARARHINAFPRPTWLSLCRAHVGHVGRADFTGIMRGGWKGMGRMRPVGGMGRRAPRRAAFPLAVGFSGRLRPACGLHAEQVLLHGRAGAFVLNRHAFEVARHHVGQVGHVGHPTSKSKAYQRFSPPDMAFPMSGACRACRARRLHGHHAGRMEGHGPDAARGRHGEAHAAPGGLCGLVVGRG